MLFRPRKGTHFSRKAMGLVFLACGLLLLTVHVLAGGIFLLLAAVILWYAPRWDLRIEVEGGGIRFSENLVATHPVDLRFADIKEIRRVAERLDRKGLFSSYAEYQPFVELETKGGETFRMHDIFGEDFDEEVLREGAAAGVRVEDFPRH
jgi:hypothetical protein